MTFESPHFVENGGAQNNAIDLRLVYASLAGRGESGVAFGGDLAVTEKGTPDMSVDIAAGAAFVASTRSDNQGTYHAYNNATINQAISAADPTDPRIDRVCVQIRDEAQDAGLTQNDVRIFVEEGTPAAVPAAPSISIEDYVELAQVTVPAGASSITNSDITDKRVRYAANGGTLVCTSSTRPSPPTDGRIIYETDTDRLLVYDGTNWVRLSGSESDTGSGTVGTSFATIGASVTVGAGDWIIMAKGNWDHAAASSGITYSAELHDGTSQLDLARYTSAATSSRSGFSLLAEYTAAGSTTIDVRVSRGTVGGTHLVENVVIVAIPA